MSASTRDLLLTCEEMRAAEEAVFETGIDAEHLMDVVGARMADIILRRFPRQGTVIAFVGAGHNGGDALVVARILGEVGWEVFVRPAVDVSEFRPLTARKLEQIGELATQWDSVAGLRPDDPRPVIFLDGLLGIGAKGPLRPGYREAAAEMNALRLQNHGTTFALDLPSGLDGEDGIVHEGAVIADFTLTIGYGKAGLIEDGALENTGRLAVVPFPEIEALPGQGDETRRIITAGVVGKILQRRKFSMHKGASGRVGIVAGSPGFTGAASLCAAGALHGGAGLVTVFVNKTVYPIVAAAAPPEAMVHSWHLPQDIDTGRADVLAIGPGIGTSNDANTLLRHHIDFRGPMVIDADALNIIALEGLKLVSAPPAPRLLTPHPGELARLLGVKGLGDRPRAEVAGEFVQDNPVTLLFKGSRTIIAEKGQPLSFNSTGHPGMASGGMGDVLTGLCAALIAQGLTLCEAACTGSWLLGRAAEIALFHGSASPESLTAGEVAGHLGLAFNAARSEEE